MSIKKLFSLFLAIIFSFFITTENLVCYASEIENAFEEKEKKEDPNYLGLVTLNSFFPGTGQIIRGDTSEGINYLVSTTLLSITGQVLLFYYFADLKIDIEKMGGNNSDGKTYLSPFIKVSKEKEWMFYSGLALSLYSQLIGTYSTYSLHRDIKDEDGTGLKKGKEDLVDLIKAPFQAENVFNFDVFPFYPMSVFFGTSMDEFKNVPKFFQRDKVDFMGMQFNPFVGLILVLVTNMIIVLANATWEEIFFRGISLESSGLVNSSLFFGSAHIANMLSPNASVEDTLAQTAFATLFGFYAGNKTQTNNYDFRRMIALHFWHNVTASTLGYMANPDKTTFSIGFNTRF